MNTRVLEIRRVGRLPYDHPSRFQRRSQHESLALGALFHSSLLCERGGGSGFVGGEAGAEGEERGVCGLESEAVGEGVAGLGEVREGEEREGAAVEGFYVGGV